MLNLSNFKFPICRSSLNCLLFIQRNICVYQWSKMNFNVNNLNKFLQKSETVFIQMRFEKTFQVDFIYTFQNVKVSRIRNVVSANWFVLRECLSMTQLLIKFMSPQWYADWGCKFIKENLFSVEQESFPEGCVPSSCRQYPVVCKLIVHLKKFSNATESVECRWI